MITVQPPWISPTLCGCAFRVTVTRTHSAARRAALVAQFGDAVAAIWIDRLTQTVQFDETVETPEILWQCPAHAGFVGAAALWEELHHLEAIGHGADTCPCRIAHWRDDRTDAPFTPMEHPEGTARCPLHAHLLDTTLHHDTVERENVRKNLVLTRLAETLGVEAASLGFAYTAEDRTAFTVTHPTLTQAALEAAVKALPAGTLTGDLSAAVEALRAQQLAVARGVRPPATALVVLRVAHG